MRRNKAAWSEDEEDKVERDGEERGIPNITPPQDDDEQGETQHQVKKPGRP